MRLPLGVWGGWARLGWAGLGCHAGTGMYFVLTVQYCVWLCGRDKKDKDYWRRAGGSDRVHIQSQDIRILCIIRKRCTPTCHFVI